MARPIWKGQISFGLVNIPVSVYSAERRTDLGFKLIDSRNSARVRYERINEENGKEVPWNAIVKGYEYDNGNYVLLTDNDLESAAVEMTKVIEIEQFAALDEIENTYFDKPYYITPNKGAEKGYVILREAMDKLGKVGIAKVVIRTRQYLSAVVPDGNCLILNLLRFPEEVIPASEFDFPGEDLKQYKITAKEIQLAKDLVTGMTSKWNPENYHDEYRETIMKMIEGRVKAGKTDVVESVDTERELPPRTINFMDVLKKSLARSVRPKKSSAKPRRTTKKVKAKAK